MKKQMVLVVSLLAILVFASVSAHAVQSAIATLIRDQDAPGRHPFTATCSAFNSTLANNAQCSMAVPAGQEVIVQSVSFVGMSDPTNANMAFSVIATGAGNATVPVQLVVNDAGTAQPSKASFPGTQLAWFPADPATNITCAGFIKGEEAAGKLGLSCNVSGYYVTLP
jgi:hypothetical protein